MPFSDTPPPAVPPRIIQVTAAYLDAIAPLFDAYRQFYGLPADLDAARAYLAARIERNESVIFLALLPQSDGEIAAGFTQLYPSFGSLALRPVWILYDLFITPACRRYGVGRALLERARILARDTGAAELSLQTALDNLSAQALYESAGWKRDDHFYTYTLTP
ncbi:MAG: hypothetical protein OJF49_001123 [Ktedonobacterales bacterium]|jgi:GNAT superfamily N-acetyltransferase|nr:MAG: hypothetical protein OJF49_001123 [Ktedonobacterales bacterium]